MTKKQKNRPGRFFSPKLKNASNTLLANVRFASVDAKVKVISVTSSNADEGKTTVCTNLACAMASSGKSVLLVETDMRKRSLARVAEIHAPCGLYALLSGEATLDETVEETSVPNVFVLDTEPSIPNPPDLLSSRRFAALVEALRIKFDYVIFDTPPLGLFVDAALVGSVMDGVLFVVRERSTKMAQASACLSQLEQANARILGLVTTFSKENARDEYYYYAYYKETDGDLPEQPSAAEGALGEREAYDSLDGDFDAWARRIGIGDLVKEREPRHLAQSKPTGQRKAPNQRSVEWKSRSGIR